MDLLIVRHAIAEQRDAYSGDDARRSLTAEGRRKFERAALGLRSLVDSIGVLATSTLVRAIQTGQILEEAFEIEAAARLEELAPDADPASFLHWLLRRRGQGVVAAVGHEPHLSKLIGHLLVGRELGGVDLKKGGACLLSFSAAPKPGTATLRWLLTAGQLRRLGR